MLRLSDADETRFYRAYGHIGKARGLKDAVTDRYLQMRGFAHGPTALIAGFEGDAEQVGVVAETIWQDRKTVWGASAWYWRGQAVVRGARFTGLICAIR